MATVRLLLVLGASASRAAILDAGMQQQVHVPAHNTQSVRAQPRPQPSKPAVKVYGVGHLADGVGLYMNGVGLIMDPIRATLEEFGPRWALLQEALHSGGGQQAEAALAEHSLAAREEAARKLMSNRERILRDVTNAAPRTQRDLERVAMFDVVHVDQVMREVCRRLLGTRPSTADLQEALDPSAQAQAKVWAKTTKFLDRRLQATPSDCPGRAADVSDAAAAALRAALREVSAQALLAWADADK